MLDVRPLRATPDMDHVAKSFLDIVNAPDFWFGDRFVEAGEVVSAFSDEDWVAIRQASAKFCDDVRERIVVSMAGLECEQLVTFALHFVDQNDEAVAMWGVALLQAAGPAAGRHISSPYIETLRRAWLAFPSMRPRIKQTAWDKGVSGELRRTLGFESWPP